MLRGFIQRTELRAKRLRYFADMPQTGPIDPLLIASKLDGVVVFNTFDQLQAAVGRSLELAELAKEVSAFTVLIGDTHFIIQNDEHSPLRRRASLMEELAHIVLDHEPSTVSMSLGSLLNNRTYNAKQEQQAYALGAATLVPYDELAQLLLEAGRSFQQVSEYYEVSKELVEYRAKITLLWRNLDRSGRLSAARS